MLKKLLKKYHADWQDGKVAESNAAHASSTRVQGFRNSAWNVQAGMSQIQENYLFIGTRLRHIDSGLRCKQEVCHHEQHLRHRLTLLELERSTLGKFDGICGMAWISFPWNQSVRQCEVQKCW